MNILYIAPIVPYPLIDGDRQRAYHLLQVLAKNHTVHLLCFVRSHDDQVALQQLKPHVASVHGVSISQFEIKFNALLGWFSNQPLNVLAFKKKAMHKKIAQLIKRYNINAIHAYRLRMAQYALATNGIYRVLDYTDAMVRYFQNRMQQNRSWVKKIYINHELKRLKKYEAQISNFLDTCLVSSPHDQEIILGNGGAPWIEVVSNGVDTSQYEGAQELTKEPYVLFVGNMNYVPNAEGLRWFCQSCWPLILAKHGQAQLHIVGQPPVGTINQNHKLYPGATFKGVVPDLSPELDQARVGICPVQIASGRQFKVIEYFAAQLPVVTTSLVAKNLDANHEHHLLVADDGQDFSQQVCRLLEDNTLANKVRDNARELAKKNYDWSIVGKQLIKQYGKLEDAAQVKDGTEQGSIVERMKQHQVLRTRRKR